MTIDLAIDRDCSLFFGTPVVTLRPEGAAAVNAEPAQQILDRAVREPGVARSNAGGWQSRPDRLNWGGPAVAAYRGWLEQAVHPFFAPGERISIACNVAITDFAVVPTAARSTP